MVSVGVVCLDAATGAVRWLAKTPLHLESSPAIWGDVVIVGAGAVEAGEDHKPKTHPGYVLAARLSDGEVLWTHDVNDPESSPALRDGVAYIGSGFNGTPRSVGKVMLAHRGRRGQNWG